MDRITTVEDVYGRLRGRGRLEWIGGSKSAAAIYFERGKRKYKIFFDDTNVEVSQEKSVWGRRYWDKIAEKRYINPGEGPAEVYETVVWAINEYTGRNEREAGS